MKRLSTLALLLVGLTGCNTVQSEQLPVSVGDYIVRDSCVLRNDCRRDVCGYVYQVHDISGSWVLWSLVNSVSLPSWNHLPSRRSEFWIFDSPPTCSAPPTSNDPE